MRRNVEMGRKMVVKVRRREESRKEVMKVSVGRGVNLGVERAMGRILEFGSGNWCENGKEKVERKHLSGGGKCVGDSRQTLWCGKEQGTLN